VGVVAAAVARVSERDGWTNGVYLTRERWLRLDALAAERGVKRSALIGLLVDEAAERRGAAPDVRVNGRRFVPAREKKAAS
jgi:predicted DNA-binding ribbon-helix-helix protein